jgi:hypothetical protein
MKEKLFLSLFLWAILSGAAMSQVFGTPHVSANARVQASFSGTNGVPLVTQTFSTSQLPITGNALANLGLTENRSDPFGTLFGITNTATFSASAGVLRASTSSAVRITGNSIGTSVRSEASDWVLAPTNPGASFLDTITLVGPGIGSTIGLTITALFEGSSAESAPDAGSSSSSTRTFGNLNVFSSAGGATDITHNGADGVNAPFSYTQSFVTTITIGTPFQIGGSLTASSIAARTAIDGFASSQFNASNTAYVSIAVPSGYTLSSSSGYSYAPVPEPASIAAIGLGVAGLLRRRTKTS